MMRTSTVRPAGPRKGETGTGRQPGVAVLAWVLAGTVFVLAVASLLLARLNGGDLGVVGFSLPFLTFAGVGAVVASRRPENPLSWYLLAIPVSIWLYALLQQFATYVLVTRPGALPGGTTAAWVATPLWVPAAVLTLVVMPLLFPDGRPLSSRWRGVGWAAVAVATILVVSLQVVAWPQRGPALLQEEAAWQEPIATLVSVLFLCLVACGFAALGSLVARYRRAGTVERLQLKWFAAAVALMLTVFAAAPLVLDDGAIDLAVYPLAVAAAFRPVRARVQRAVDRRFDRARYDAQRTVERFAQRLRDEVDLDALRADLVQVMSAAIRPARASLWLPSPKARS